MSDATYDRAIHALRLLTSGFTVDQKEGLTLAREVLAAHDRYDTAAARAAALQQRLPLTRHVIAQRCAGIIQAPKFRQGKRCRLAVDHAGECC